MTEQRLSLEGQKFNRLLVIGPTNTMVERNYLWECLCDCGERTQAKGTQLKSGHVKSCGCLKREIVRVASLKHGHATRGFLTPEYRSWQHMQRRCYNSQEPGYPRYGARGIRVCDRWRNSFADFFADVGPRPGPKHSLGRIDNDGNYEPGNVRWETPLEQGSNNSRNRNFTINGRTQCLAAWVRERGLVTNTVHRRLKRGLSIEDALEIPARDPRKMGRPEKLDAAACVQAAVLRESGMPVERIAERFEVSISAIYNVTNKKPKD